jgi:hypothetical protein
VGDSFSRCGMNPVVGFPQRGSFLGRGPVPFEAVIRRRLRDRPASHSNEPCAEGIVNRSGDTRLASQRKSIRRFRWGESRPPSSARGCTHASQEPDIWLPTPVLAGSGSSGSGAPTAPVSARKSPGSRCHTSGSRIGEPTTSAACGNRAEGPCFGSREISWGPQWNRKTSSLGSHQSE